MPHYAYIYKLRAWCKSHGVKREFDKQVDLARLCTKRGYGLLPIGLPNLVGVGYRGHFARAYIIYRSGSTICNFFRVQT